MAQDYAKADPARAYAERRGINFGDRAREALANARSEEHTSELQSLMRISYAVFCLKNKKKQKSKTHTNTTFRHNKSINKNIDIIYKHRVTREIARLRKCVTTI